MPRTGGGLPRRLRCIYASRGDLTGYFRALIACIGARLVAQQDRAFVVENPRRFATSSAGTNHSEQAWVSSKECLSGKSTARGKGAGSSGMADVAAKLLAPSWAEIPTLLTRLDLQRTSPRGKFVRFRLGQRYR